MPGDNEYFINVNLNIANVDSTSSTNSNTAGEEKKNENHPTQQNQQHGTEMINSTLSAFNNANYVLSKANAVANAFGNSELSNAVQSLSKATGYAIKGVMALSGNPVAAVDLVVSAVVDVVNSIKQQMQEESAKLNEQDIARIRSGLYDVEGTTAKKDFFTGRLIFLR